MNALSPVRSKPKSPTSASSQTSVEPSVDDSWINESWIAKLCQGHVDLRQMSPQEHAALFAWRDAKGQSCVHHLVTHNQVKQTQWCLKHGALIHAMDHQRRTPLALAVDEGHGDMVSMLLAYGADLRKAPAHDKLLIRAINGQHVEVVRSLLVAGAHPNEGNRYAWYAPLAMAVLQKPWSLEIILDLLRWGASPHASLSHGDTLLHEVARRLDEPGADLIWEALCHRGARVDVINQQGQTPLDIQQAYLKSHACLTSASSSPHMRLHPKSSC